MNTNAHMKKAIRDNEKAAECLTTVGMAVKILLDSGETRITKLTTLPWALGHGVMVAKVEGVSGGYECTRITPVLETEPENG